MYWNNIINTRVYDNKEFINKVVLEGELWYALVSFNVWFKISYLGQPMKIGNVSEQTGLSAHTIRFYEKQGLIKKANKDASGHRVYSSKDIELLNWISCMKNSGMPLKKIHEYTAAFSEDNANAAISILEVHLLKLKAQKKDVEHYIDVTIKKICNLKSP